MTFCLWISRWLRLFFEDSAVASVKIANFSGKGSLCLCHLGPQPPFSSYRHYSTQPSTFRSTLQRGTLGTAVLPRIQWS